MTKKLLITLLLTFFAAQVFAYGSEDVHFLNIGLEGYKSKFKEGGQHSDREEEGTFKGAFVKFTTYKPFGSYSSSSDNFFTFEASYARADVDRTQTIPVYTGYPGEGIPVFINREDLCTGGVCAPADVLASYSQNAAADRKQWVTELRALGGTKIINTDNFDVEGFVGFGFRYHRDSTKEDYSAYVTEKDISTTYLYLPLGASAKLHASGFSLKITGEFDWLFLASKQNRADFAFYPDAWQYVDAADPALGTKNGQEIYGYDRVRNDSSGIGAKISADLEIDAGPIGITVSPFYRYWKVNSYNKQHLEMSSADATQAWAAPDGTPRTVTYPKSTASEYGVQVSILF